MSAEENIAESINRTIIAITQSMFFNYFDPLRYRKSPSNAIPIAAQSDLEFIASFGGYVIRADQKLEARVNAYREVLSIVNSIPPEVYLNHPDFVNALHEFNSPYTGYAIYPPWKGFPNIVKLMPSKHNLIGQVELLKKLENSNTEPVQKLIRLGEAYIKLLTIEYPDIRASGHSIS